MTAPVADDDIVQGCVKWLLQFPDVLAVLGTSPEDGSPLLTQHRLYRVMESTQSTAAVVIHAGGWAGPNGHNTMRFPRLSLEITVDPIRDAGNNAIDPGEANRRITKAYKAIDAHLHRPQGGVQYWGDIRTIGCARQGEPTIYAISDGGGSIRLQVFYGVIEG